MKYFLLFSLVLINVALFGQRQTPVAVSDTITNTEVDTVYLPDVLNVDGALFTVSWQIFAQQLSGTTDLTVKPVVSNRLSGAAATSFTVMASDSIDLDGASNKILTIVDSPAARAGVQITGSGTQSTRYTIYPRVIKRRF